MGGGLPAPRPSEKKGMTTSNTQPTVTDLHSTIRSLVSQHLRLQGLDGARLGVVTPEEFQGTLEVALHLDGVRGRIDARLTNAQGQVSYASDILPLTFGVRPAEDDEVEVTWEITALSEWASLHGRLSGGASCLEALPLLYLPAHKMDDLTAARPDRTLRWRSLVSVVDPQDTQIRVLLQDSSGDLDTGLVGRQHTGSYTRGDWWRLRDHGVMQGDAGSDDETEVIAVLRQGGIDVDTVGFSRAAWERLAGRPLPGIEEARAGQLSPALFQII